LENVCINYELSYYLTPINNIISDADRTFPFHNFYDQKIHECLIRVRAG